MDNSPRPIIDDALAVHAVARHGFFTREGGVSHGIYASLNCGPGSNDERDHVRENRRRVAEFLGVGAQDLVSCYQVHSAEAVVVKKPWAMENAHHADAMVTNVAGIALGILTADCVPVLFLDPVARVIGAAHAGWKGAIGGVIEATVSSMRSLGAEPGNIIAAIGPCIQQGSYEVGQDFLDRFIEHDPENVRFFSPSVIDERHMFDISSYVASRLQACGVGQGSVCYADTASDEDRFFSYRRACLRDEKEYGRMISAICLTNQG